MRETLVEQLSESADLSKFDFRASEYFRRYRKNLQAHHMNLISSLPSRRELGIGFP